jgi:D-arabinose 1-dehydrogenase-like Zn-dependent alcohol dehydrogenase
LIVRGQTAFSHTSVSEFAAFTAAHAIKPVIAATYPFALTITAFEALQRQNSVGKIAINIE